MFNFVGYRELEIDKRTWLKVAILSINDMAITFIYLPATDKNIDFVESLDLFEDVTSSVAFSIKSNGKPGLSFKF